MATGCTYARQYTVNQLVLPSEKYQALQNLMGQVEQDERSQVVFKKAGS